ncbi:hypothetical protein C8R43DRAFT_1080584 [Mycena crocata]|nr:hypothetical protein C8R43DRAFT_1080584 [Mycena crocata]
MGAHRPLHPPMSPLRLPLSLLPLPLVALLVLLFNADVAAAAPRNITIDDTDSAISYLGTWEASENQRSSLDYGGTHPVSSTGGSAVFTFTGTAVYYLSPRWPYNVSTNVALDSAAPVYVNLTDPLSSPSPPGGSESALSAVVWSATGLANTTHKLTLTAGPDGYTVADGFIYTVDDGAPASSSSAAATSHTSLKSSPTSTKSSVPSPTPAHTNITAIALAAALGAAALIAAIILAVFLLRRRRRRNPQKYMSANGNRKNSNVLDEWGNDDAYGGGGGAPIPVVVPFTAVAASRRESGHTPNNMSDASTGPLLAHTHEAYQDPYSQDPYRDSVRASSYGDVRASSYGEFGGREKKGYAGGYASGSGSASATGSHPSGSSYPSGSGSGSSYPSGSYPSNAYPTATGYANPSASTSGGLGLPPGAAIAGGVYHDDDAFASGSIARSASSAGLLAGGHGRGRGDSSASAPLAQGDPRRNASASASGSAYGSPSGSQHNLSQTVASSSSAPHENLAPRRTLRLANVSVDAAAARRGEKARPLREEVYTPAPPAYTES